MASVGIEGGVGYRQQRRSIAISHGVWREEEEKFKLDL